MTARRFALVAGEASGDRLGAGLIGQLAARYPGARFIGVGGPRMTDAGLHTLAPLETLSVMGLIEPLKHLPGLVALRRRLYREIRAFGADAFIGVDAPDFNLGLARRLRAAGTPTAHYVSPQVWAWRRWRADGIARSVDLMLTLFPFEVEFYRERNIPVRCVGHPLADAIAPRTSTAAARAELGVDFGGAPVLALLPGSRRGEIAHHAAPFADAAARLAARLSALRVRFGAADASAARRIVAALDAAGAGPVDIVTGRTRTLIAAADLVLAASGTVTLETLLLKKPLVVAYKTSPAAAWLARRLVKVAYFALPNLLAGERLVPEYFQHDATPQRLADALYAWRDDDARRRVYVERCDAIHASLRGGAATAAAAAVAELIEQRRT